jgi:membrane fusion protein (multidrug efflux system)
MDVAATERHRIRRAAQALAPRIAWRRIVKWAVITALVVIVAVVGTHYWHLSQAYETTNDAYVNADTTQIAAQVAGPVMHVYIRDQQHVKAGDLLFDIDAEPFRVAVDAAEAQLRLAQQSVEEQGAAVTAARALLQQRIAELQNAQSNERRTRNLIKQGFLSAQSAEATQTTAATAAAAVEAARANLAQAISALGEGGPHNAAIQAAEARVRQARLDLEHTRVYAPTSGTVANLTLRPGSPVQPLVPVFSLVSDRGYWVDANFKETQLDRLQPGQAATVRVDMYPHHRFEGRVQSLSGGSGAAFSLLPPENATGNWVKVTQRVPVRVRIVDADPAHPLRVGTTATVRVAVR